MWIQVGDEPEPALSGPGASVPEIAESARRVYKRHRNALRERNERLLVDGAEHRVSTEDIERLAGFDTRATFMLAIIIELMICLRTDPHI